MKLDMHCHTMEGSPDSKVPIESYIDSLKRQGFDGMLVTDHDSYGGYTWYERKLKDKIRDFVVLRGIEYDTLDAGHIIVILPKGIELGILEFKGLPLKVLIKIVHEYGGILGPAHPCGEPFLSIFSTGKYKKDISVIEEFDFIEGYNCGEGTQTNLKAQQLAAKYGKPVTGGSDSHKEDCVGLAFTILDEQVKDEDELIEYIRAGRNTLCGGQQYMGTIKEHLGRFNKILVYGFFPYNKAGAIWNSRKRKGALANIKWDLKDFDEHKKECIERLESDIYNLHDEIQEYVSDILEHRTFRDMKIYRHHAQVSTLEHSERVALYSGRVAKMLPFKSIDQRAVIRGALLHDFYLYDWHHADDGEHKWHGYHHADKARKNAIEMFDIGKKEQDIIHTHMWPLNITRIPKSKEAWIVCLVDKCVSMKESLLRGR